MLNLTNLVIELSLGAQFAAKILGRIGGRTTDGLGHFGHIHDDRFNAVTLALYLGRDARHLVAIEQVGDIAIHIDRTHDENGTGAGIGGTVGICCCGGVFGCKILNVYDTAVDEAGCWHAALMAAAGAVARVTRQFSVNCRVGPG